MTDVPGLFAALAAGLLSFLSPCVLPLIPVYLSFISGESVEALRGARRRWVLLGRSATFVAGFTVVFVALALAFGGGMGLVGMGSSRAVMRALTRVAGVVVILLAINILFDFIPFLRFERRASPRASGRIGALRAFLIGMAFAAGWTPCVGPILSSILLYAGNGGSAFRAAMLLAAYSAGLGIPFILSGLFLDRALPLLNLLKRHMRAIKIVSAVLLIALAIPLLLAR